MTAPAVLGFVTGERTLDEYRVMFAGILMAGGAFFAALNWLMRYQTWRTGRFHSAVPVGGVFLFIGMLLSPVTRPFAWAGLLLDYGTLTLLLAAPAIAGELWATCRFNLVEEYAGQSGRRTVRLRLYRKGVFILLQDIRRQPGELGLLSLSNIGTYERSGSQLLLRLGDQLARFDELTEPGSAVLRQRAGFPDYEANPETALAGFDLVLRFKRADAV